MGVGRRVSAGLFVGGACAVSGQIILLRELLVVFHGNELSLGAILAGWLLWGAAGSWLIGSRADRFRRPVLILAVLLALASVLIPATVFASACMKRALGASPVETLGFFEFLPAVLVLLGPMCFVLGSLFAVGARILAELAPARNEVSRAYLLESAGAGVGGLVISLWVLPRLQPLALSFVLGVVLLGISLLLVGEVRSRRKRVSIRLALAAVMAAYVAGALHPLPDTVRRAVQWHGMGLLEARNSLLGSLAAINLEGETSLYENGLLVATSGYQFHAEELVHLGMVQHPKPRSVLLLGGGLGGSLLEILKYPIEHCDCVELDPMLVDLGRRHLPAQGLMPLSDPRVTLHHVDGRYFVKNAPRKYDVVLLDLPGPRSAQLNRFYSLEFFREVRQVLREGGVLLFQIASSEVYPAPEQRLLLASVRKTARLAFPQVAALPGDMCYFVLSTGPPAVTDADTILARLDALEIERAYIEEGLLSFRLTPWRAAQLEEALGEKEQEAQVNQDFRPLGYLYDLAQWSAQFPGPLRRWLGKIVAARPFWAYLLLPGLFLVLGLVKYVWKGSAPGTAGAPAPGRAVEAGATPLPDQRFAVGAAVCVTGLSEIVFQVTVLVSFQVIYGYLFYRIGVMVAAFMAGLAAGSFLFWRKGGLPAAGAWRWFLRVHVAISLYPVFLPLIFKSPPRSEIYMCLPAMAGFLGGLEFPLAVGLWQHWGRRAGSAAGVLYGLDLFGACVGAMIVTPFLIPVVGLVGICWWTVVLNAGTLALLLLPFRRGGLPVGSKSKTVQRPTSSRASP